MEKNEEILVKICNETIYLLNCIFDQNQLTHILVKQKLQYFFYKGEILGFTK